MTDTVAKPQTIRERFNVKKQNKLATILTFCVKLTKNRKLWKI